MVATNMVFVETIVVGDGSGGEEKDQARGFLGKNYLNVCLARFFQVTWPCIFFSFDYKQKETQNKLFFFIIYWFDESSYKFKAYKMD